MKMIREDDIISLRITSLSRFGQEPLVTYVVGGNSIEPVEQPDGRFVMRKSKVSLHSLSHAELGQVVESFLQTSVSKTVIIILDGSTPDAMSYEKLMQLCDLAKQKNCARIVITSTSFRWREPER